MDETTPKMTADQQMLVSQALERLRQEYTGVFPAETVERVLTGSRRELESRVQATTRLPILIERYTRDRLRALARVEGLVADGRPSVLFLCVHNAGRSQMAAGWLRHLAGNGVEVFSGGSEPASDINAIAVEAMAEVGIDIRTELPQPWSDEIVRAVDAVVTMGCGDTCPVFPGKRYEDWELTDPAGQPIEVVRMVRDDIETRVRALMAFLDLPSRT